MTALGVGGFLLLALAGAFGAVLRYLLDFSLSAAQHRRANNASRIFPWGILLANTVASLLVGTTVAWAANHHLGLLPSSLGGIPALVALALVLGVGGGLSTMSTFVVAVVSLWRSGARAMSTSYAAITLGAGLGAALAGRLVGSLLP